MLQERRHRTVRKARKSVEEKQALNSRRWEFLGELQEEEYKTIEAKDTSGRGWYKCRTCGSVKDYRLKHFDECLILCKNGCHKHDEIKGENHAENMRNWEYIRDLAKHEYSELGYRQFYGRAWYKCKTCGELKAIDDFGFRRDVQRCKTGCYGYLLKGCTTVVTEENCVGTIYPHLKKYFVNEEDTRKYLPMSNVVVQLICPNCGQTKKMSIAGLVSGNGIACTSCGDGVSFGEKVFASILRQANVKYQREYSIDNGKHRYDFFLPEHSVIVEIHGMQHYSEEGRQGRRTLEEEQENDRVKEAMAIEYGIRHYVVIDARYSELEWIKNNVLNSKIPKILNFQEEDIDWIEAESYGSTSLVREVCDYWNSHTTTPTEMQEVFSIKRNTIRNYLKRGAKLGLCSYSVEEASKEARARAGQTRRIPVKGTNLLTGEVVIFSGAKEAEEVIGKGRRLNISACCRGKSRASAGYSWEYISKEEYQDYIEKQKNDPL